MSASTVARRLVRDRSGVAMTEFALALPFLLTTGLWGAELVNFTIVKMKVNELATHLADNASRIGDTSTLQNRKVFESDINDLFLGSNIQGSRTLNFFEHGRAIVSSLEVKNVNSGKQEIAWQRCKGKKVYPSTYGEQGDKVTGMGPGGEQVTAAAEEGVIFVEVAYEYQPLVSDRFVGTPVIKSIASYVVRDKRDYSKIHQRKPTSPDAVSECSVHDGFPPLVI